MRIALYGGTGMIGSRITREAADRGHRVTVLTRSGAGEVPDGVARRIGDAGDDDDVAMVSAQHDVVISAIRPHAGGRAQDYLDTIQTLVENVGPRRLIVMGGAGSLQISPGLRLVDTPDFPSAARAEELIQVAALDLLRDSQNLADWVYVSPAPSVAAGERTGRYVLGAETLIGDFITAEDLAVAILDEVEHPRFRRARIAVAAAPYG